jgi:hypothetical protein
MRIAISSGHGKYVRGANGLIDEVDEARKVVDQVATYLLATGVKCSKFHDDQSKSQSENLNRITDWHNKQDRDYDVSVHFNAYQSTSKPMGTECLYVTQSALASQMSDAISEAAQFIDRGPKKRTDLHFLNETDKPAILIETCFVDSSVDVDLYKRHFFSICRAITSVLQQGDIPKPPKPEPEPPTPGARPTIKEGDKGPAVVELQKALGVLVADGDFGGATDAWVRAFQGAAGLNKDGVVGPTTWGEVDKLSFRVANGAARLPKRMAEEIYTAAMTSEIADYSWPDRGVAPPGYIPGMALAFAYAVRELADGDEAAAVMARAQGAPDTCALKWYEQEFKAVGMNNGIAGTDTLRHLFVMMIGLGPRESSGRYCEGRDMSASNVASDTAEAGAFQTSWNIRSANSTIPPLLEDFWDNPNGFLPQFKEGTTATTSNLDSYGSGDGIRYQFLSRFAPLFHVMVTGVGMRTLRQHWGPINRREVTLRREADELLKQVQEIALREPEV